MFKYFHIIKFLLTNNIDELKVTLNNDFNRGKVFKWRRVIRGAYKNKNPYLLWWRIANAMFLQGNKKQLKCATRINRELVSKYNTDIGLGAKIGQRLSIAHYIGIVITDCTEIGDNCHIVQNLSIAIKSLPTDCRHRFKEYSKQRKIKIGNNVSIGAGSVILGNNLVIGDNVKIGAMSFINKDIPSNCTVYTEKTNKIIINQA